MIKNQSMKRRGVCVYVLREKWRGAGRVTVLKQLKGPGEGGGEASEGRTGTKCKEIPRADLV